MTTTTSNGNHQQDGGGVASRLARQNILELAPYRCARDDYSTGILLDANENAYGPSLPAQKRAENVLERYPDPYQIPLKERFVAYRVSQASANELNFLTPKNVFVGVGSDEAIDLLMRIFCKPGQDKILQTPPTYGMYKVCAKVNDVDIVNVPLTPKFDIVVPDILAAVTPDVKLIFVCSPGNPTCKAIPVADVEAVARGAPNSIVVVDEAYIDFANPTSQASAVRLIDVYPNVVVLQTLSKAFGLAAIRCGFCIGRPDIIQLMNNVKAPYNVNQLTSQMAITALDPTNTRGLQETIQTILQQRAYVMEELTKLGFVVKVHPSDSNFILFQLKEKAQEVYKTMADTSAVVTRYRGNELHCDNCIRVTVGTPDENKAFLAALQDIYPKVVASN